MDAAGIFPKFPRIEEIFSLKVKIIAFLTAAAAVDIARGPKYPC